MGNSESLVCRDEHPTERVNGPSSLILALAVENAELHQQLAIAQDMLMETAIDAGQLHARVEALGAERDAWRAEAERLAARGARTACSRDGSTSACYSPRLPAGASAVFATPYGATAGEHAVTGEGEPVPLPTSVTPRPGGRVRVEWQRKGPSAPAMAY